MLGLMKETKIAADKKREEKRVCYYPKPKYMFIEMIIKQEI